MICFGHALCPHDAIVRLIAALLEHAHAALIAALGVAAQAIGPGRVQAARHVEEALALQQGVLRAEEQAQRVLGALGRGEPVAEVALVADGQDLARRKEAIEPRYLSLFFILYSLFFRARWYAGARCCCTFHPSGRGVRVPDRQQANDPRTRRWAGRDPPALRPGSRPAQPRHPAPKNRE
jgi:hypothetical protein